MNPQPDQFFREKLEHFQLPVPPSAWARIEKNLTQHKRFFYLRIAASLLLLMVAGWTTYSLLSVPESGQSLTNPTIVSVRPESPTEPLKNEIADKIVHSPTEASGKKKLRKPAPPGDRKPVVSETTSVQEIELEQTASIENTSAAVKGSTVIISLAEAQQFLKGEISSTQATNEIKKTSRLQRLVELATVIASEEDVMGRLRESKDELLVRNVRTGMQHNN